MLEDQVLCLGATLLPAQQEDVLGLEKEFVMPIENDFGIEKVPGTEQRYYLLHFDADGRERTVSGEPLVSEQVVEELKRENYTDIFIFSHGWMSDIPYAKFQYVNWLKAMLGCTADIEKMKMARPGFKPLLVALHWPSRPWGSETLETGLGDFGVSHDGVRVPTDGKIVEEYAALIGDTNTAHNALNIILENRHIDSHDIPPNVIKAYQELDRESSLPVKSVEGAPGADREGFDPQAIIDDSNEFWREDAHESMNTGLFKVTKPSWDVLLQPIRVLSFWKMKERARRFGEGAAHQLLVRLQSAASDKICENGEVRFHTMGHSFGCIVVSGMVAGPPNTVVMSRPVHSMVLMQGALSIWSYCSDIPVAKGKPGYFRRLITNDRVNGPIVTTKSRYDKAIGQFYPLGAGMRQQIEFRIEDFPRYGALGAWGIQGPGLELVEIDMRGTEITYDFEARKIYNVDGSNYIRKNERFTGAHSDIAHAEIAHVVWEAALPR